METIYLHVTVWLGLAVFSAILAHHLKVSIALVEICVGMIAANIVHQIWGSAAMPSDEQWLKFLASAGSILLTFLAGAELDPDVMKSKLREVSVVGLVGFAAPFFGCAWVAHHILGWAPRASWLAGIALSTTSMAVVYAVMLETGLNETEFGKGVLGACFINDLGTVIALGLLFAPFTHKTVIFVVASLAVFLLLPRVTTWITNRYGFRTAAIRTKWLVFILFALGALALWSGSEAVLPAYIAGMVLAEFTAEDRHFMRRLRTLTVGFLTPFYFLRAGSFVSIPALAAAPFVFLGLLGGKTASKIFGLYPVVARFRKERKERWYYTLLMSTGLTFGTISALYGYTHKIVSREQYSFLVTAVIASAVIPTLIANWAFFPKHLLPPKPAAVGIKEEEDLSEE
jgi:glutathione-regulated potassium-efflux system ancillary protein KefC